MQADPVFYSNFHLVMAKNSSFHKMLQKLMELFVCLFLVCLGFFFRVGWGRGCGGERGGGGKLAWKFSTPFYACFMPLFSEIKLTYM